MTLPKTGSSKRTNPPRASDYTKGFRKDWERHIGGDFLLIYRLDGEAPNEAIIFVRAGTHAELFE